ncbi:MAG: RNA polymerase factor sigma-54 [Victivallaceae bacterium]|nr:RNA polymerase factor sigma-54 [Victivallaceae bacterium]
MENSLQQSAKLQQKQQLSARQRTSLEFLQLSRQELDARLNEELAENPLLEEIFPEDLPQESLPDMPPEKEDEAEFDARFAESDQWHSELPLPGEEGEESTADFWSGIAAPPPTLAEQLAREFAGSPLDPKIREIAQMIVESLDEKGYLSTPLADLAMSCDADLDEVEKALKFVQSLEPAGIGARTLDECFRLQLERSGKWHGAVKKIVENGLDDLERFSPRTLAEKYQLTPGEFQQALAVLRKLDPAPGGSETHAAVVLPDIEIFSTENGGFDARLLKERERRFNICQRYEKLLDDPGVSAEDRAFVRDKIRAAQEVIQSLDMRESTLLRLGRWIANRQRDFFRDGVEKLLPLTMKQAGKELELHETTISRAVSGKYAKTPQGALALRFFFTTGGVSGGEQEISNRAIGEKIRQIIAEEDKSHPLSDDAVAKKLKGSGISIARRTVAKYRDQLHIAPASLRTLR